MHGSPQAANQIPAQADRVQKGPPGIPNTQNRNFAPSARSDFSRANRPTKPTYGNAASDVSSGGVETKALPGVNRGVGGVGGQRAGGGASRRAPGAMELAKGNFLPYLPQDEAAATGSGPAGGLDTSETQQVVDSANQELAILLRLSEREFGVQGTWPAHSVLPNMYGQTLTGVTPPHIHLAVQQDASLRLFLDTYLRYRHRWYDTEDGEATPGGAGVVVGDADLARRVFMVLLRM